MVRYLIAAGLAASEVGALMMIFSAIAIVSGMKSPAILLDILLFAGFATWLWRKKSPTAAALMIALVAYEYLYLAYGAMAPARRTPG